MAKHNCAICGAEVGLISGQKLADGNYICKKVCGKKCLKTFDKVAATLQDVNDHIAQVELGTKIFEEIIMPLKKTKVKPMQKRQESIPAQVPPEGTPRPVYPNSPIPGGGRVPQPHPTPVPGAKLPPRQEAPEKLSYFKVD